MKQHTIFCAILIALFFATPGLTQGASAPASVIQTIVEAARDQIGKTVGYDGSYRKIVYPNGDVPIKTGVCTDVIIRALRKALGMDLQKLVHEDMTAHFSRYPKIWGATSPDANIDHRRVPNLMTYFKRQGWQLPASGSEPNYQPGDIVTCTVPPNLPHIMVVSDHKHSSGRPLVIHNIGMGTQEEDRLTDFEITGHYRIKAELLSRIGQSTH